jgi:hypothetical protein
MISFKIKRYYTFRNFNHKGANGEDEERKGGER